MCMIYTFVLWYATETIPHKEGSPRERNIYVDTKIQFSALFI